jgi:guanosine-3',5'-bis(diphosphate) 3'-pyrophosphohydrolase
MQKLFDGLPLIDKAISAFFFAAGAHAAFDQKYGKEDYYRHLLQVASLLSNNLPALDTTGLEHLFCAAFLHDVLEDTKVNYSMLRILFGGNVAELVYLVTDESGRNRKERKSKTYDKVCRSVEAILIKLCDRIVNIQESVKTKNTDTLHMYLAEFEEFERYLYCDKYSEKYSNGSIYEEQLQSLWEQYFYSIRLAKSCV